MRSLMGNGWQGARRQAASEASGGESEILCPMELGI